MLTKSTPHPRRTLGLIAWFLTIGMLAVGLKVVSDVQARGLQAFFSVWSLALLGLLLAMSLVRRCQFRTVRKEVAVIHQKTETDLFAIFTRLGHDSDFRKRVFSNLVVQGRLRSAHIVERYAIGVDGARRTVARQFVLDRAWFDPGSAATSQVDAASGDNASSGGTSEGEGQGEAAESVPFPILVAEKGHLLNDLKVWLDSGEILTPTPYEETLRLQVAIVEGMFEQAFPGPPPRTTRTALAADGRVVRFIDLEKAALRQIARLGSPEKVLGNGRFLPVDEIIEGLGLFQSEPDAFRELTQFIRDYSDAYPIVVEVDAACLTKGRLSVNFSHVVAVDTPVDGFKDKLRIVLGLPAYRFRFPMRLAYSAESYHLGAEYAEGTYLFSQQLQERVPGGRPTYRDVSPDEVMTAPDGSASGAYVRLRRSDRGPHAHVHIRGLNTADEKRQLHVLSRFNETPPGLIGASATLSWIMFLFLGALGWLFASARGASVAPGSDVPALLLAIPGISAVMLGHDALARHTRPTSLSARLGLVSTLGLAVAAVIVYLATPRPSAVCCTAAVGQGTPEVPQVSIWMLGNQSVADLAWLGLSGLALLVSAILLSKSIEAFSNYASTAPSVTRAKGES